MQQIFTLLNKLTRLLKTRVSTFVVGLGFGIVFVVNFIGRFNINSAVDDKAFLFLTSFMLFNADAVSLYSTSFSEYCFTSAGILDPHECWWQSYYRGSTYFSYPTLSLLELILRNLFKYKDIQVLGSLSFNYGMLLSSFIAITLLAFAGKALHFRHLFIFWIGILYLIPTVLNNEFSGDISAVFGEHGFFTPAPRGLATLLGIFALYILSIGHYSVALLIGVCAATFHIQFIALLPMMLIIHHLNFGKAKWLLLLNSFLFMIYVFVYIKIGVYSQFPIFILGVLIFCKWISNPEPYSYFCIKCISWLLFISLMLFLSKAILEVLSSNYLSTFTPSNGGAVKFWYGRLVVETYNRFSGLILCSAIIIAINLLYNQFSLNSFRSKLIFTCLLVFLMARQNFLGNANNAVWNLANFSNQFIELSGSDSREMAGIYLKIANTLYDRELDK
jgi:hypothetical protein